MLDFPLPSVPRSGYSAQVRMTLVVNGHTLDVAQLASRFLILASPVDHPPAPAEVLLSVDGQQTRWPVFLDDGISPAVKKTRISRRG